jgi:hypothetical protein
MNTSKTQHVEFYKALSFLFYAIAISDKHFVDKEKIKIIDLVKKDWNIKSKEFDSEEYIYSILRKLILDEIDMELAYVYFKSFFQLNPTLFPDKIKHKIMDSVYEIATTYAKKNKSEVQMLSRVHQLMFENK